MHRLRTGKHRFRWREMDWRRTEKHNLRLRHNHRFKTGKKSTTTASGGGWDNTHGVPTQSGGTVSGRRAQRSSHKYLARPDHWDWKKATSGPRCGFRFSGSRGIMSFSTFLSHLGGTTFQNTRQDADSKDVPIIEATTHRHPLVVEKDLGRLVFPNKREENVFYKVVYAEVLPSDLVLIVGHELNDLGSSG
ncbi:hypothetical protein NPIL_623211 [Nephila pilipes]|uniref:Uncharacterized protein n=1 Tax=Nephila pilipes TaxID=299642 RepID=A0A8X6QWX9_NEPPI|nr:hypothetical protein NPIL_623211 [Nephila pilipes]